MASATSVTPSATAGAESLRVPARRPLIRAGVEATGSGPVQIFQGYDSVVGIGLGTAVEGTAKSVDARTQTYIEVCESIESLSRSLQIDQSLSVGFGPYGSADAKMSFVYNLDVTTTSVTIVCYSRHGLGKETQTSFQLASGIKPPKKDSDLVKFFQTYGDSFLTSVETGGEYYGVYVFYTQTVEEQKSLVAELHASGISSGASVDSSTQVKLDEFVSTTTTHWEFKQDQSGILNPNMPNRETFVVYAEDFPSLTLDAPAILGFETLGYERVPGMEAFKPIADNRVYFIGFGDDTGLTKDLVTLQEILNQDEWIASIYKFYGGYNDTVLNQRTEAAKAEIEAIDDQIVAYEDDPLQTFVPPNLEALGWGAPVLDYNVGQSAPYGGTTGGDPWDDVDILTTLQNKTWLSALRLRSYDEIDCLFSTYTSEATDKPPEETEHGGKGGTLGERLQFLPGQFVVSVSGRAQNRVDHLDIEITDGRSCEGGGGGGQAFDWSLSDAPTGSFVLGFKGRSKDRLDQIRVVYASFKPARWPDA
jgi:hypothetical protein